MWSQDEDVYDQGYDKAKTIEYVPWLFNNYLPIHEIVSIWALHKAELCHNLFTFQVGGIPQISLFYGQKRFLCSKKVDIAVFKIKMGSIISEAVTNSSLQIS